MLRLVAGIELVQVIKEVQEVARSHGYVVTVVSSEAPKVERAEIKTLLSHGPRRPVAIGVRANEHTSRERLAGYRAGMNCTSLAPRSGMVEHPDQGNRMNVGVS